MVSNLELQNKIAILLVSHGSSLPFAEVTFNEIKDKFNKATGFATEVGYMKVAEPSIAGAVENLKEQIKREPLKQKATLWLNPDKNIFTYDINDVKIENYVSHDKLTAKMAV